jgi:predicted glycosyltransferase
MEEHEMSIHNIYYATKPFIPRRAQILCRRLIARAKRRIHHDIWPIHPLSSTPPEGWKGWPGQKQFALLLSHDVDTAKGHERSSRLMKIEQQLGFRSSFNFVPERYQVSPILRQNLVDNGFAVGVHGLTHDGKLFRSLEVFKERAARINHYLKEWGSCGFHSPSMISNLDWIADLDIEYDCSTFDTDPFEPQPDGVKTIFPFWVVNNQKPRHYVELPYTLPQDHCLFVIFKQKDIKTWKEKLDWIAANGGLALLNTHPDYMNFDGTSCAFEEYPVEFYVSFLKYVKTKYAERCWHVLPLELARFIKDTMPVPEISNAPVESMTRSEKPKKTIWIDLDNTPHVPFFIPIKKELENRGCRVVLSARDAFQVCELATQNGLEYKKVGRHFGKYVIMKLYGWISRALALIPFVIKHKPDLALSHGSRSQVLIANLLKIPTVVIMDYEYGKVPPLTRPDWEIVPEVVSAHELPGKRVLKYTGLKEDVYVPFFIPDARILNELGLGEQDLIVTVRPPATEALYHNPEGELIFSELMNWILKSSDAKIVLLPRNTKQGITIKGENKPWFTAGRVIVPEKAINGLNLLHFSDVVISGGGTMNREAAALGVPVYSIFRGPLGAVDKRLEAEGRLIMISALEEIPQKLRLAKRNKCILYESGNRPALKQIIDHIEAILNTESAARCL